MKDELARVSPTRKLLLAAGMHAELGQGGPSAAMDSARDGLQLHHHVRSDGRGAAGFGGGARPRRPSSAFARRVQGARFGGGFGAGMGAGDRVGAADRGSDLRQDLDRWLQNDAVVMHGIRMETSGSCKWGAGGAPARERVRPRPASALR